MNHLWPLSASLGSDDSLRIAGCAVADLARKYGTPLYIFDEETLRDRCRAYRRALAAAYRAPATVAYAAKAYLCTAIARIVSDEGLDLDVVSGGELYVGLRSGFAPDRVHLHGNNKSAQELEEALSAGVGRIVVDNFAELARLDAMARSRGSIANIWLRLAPGIQAHTHSHLQTGHEASKFGFSISSGDAEQAAEDALRAKGLRLMGLHSHVGSQIFEPESLAESARRLVAFAAQLRDRHGLIVHELSPGGGWGVPMTESDPPALIEPYLNALASAIMSACEHHRLPLPHLVIEPGRSLVARAGVAVYTAGARKSVPGGSTFVALDGGMADNIRPALYGAKYSARRVAGGLDRPIETVTLAGRFCESGDILIRDIAIPHLDDGDLVAVPMSGAYTLAMANNYNLTPRPAVILVRDALARVIQRRETYADLVRRDVHPGSTDLRGSEVAGSEGVSQGVSQAASFIKYEALGNDYIVLDPVDWPDCPDSDTVRRICDRRRGVGSDGILWGPTSTDPFGLRVFNPDGSESEKSGNGLRIFARYLWDRGLPAGPDFEIRTPGGIATVHVLDERGDRILMDIGRASFAFEDISNAGVSRELVGEEARIGGHEVRFTAVSMGNPHCVVFEVDGTEIEYLDQMIELAHTLGPQLERYSLYANRTNVQFARVLDQHTLEIAIWERGAGYTLASGTSSCAAAAAAIRTGRCVSPVSVRNPGGEMQVEVGTDWSVRLTGTVTPVMTGSWFPTTHSCQN